ncbi:MAG: tRNA (guanosine(37)-N1)-methyltransferase TrmD [Spirochaetes bacterium]|nr:tRNA (guanosine(37)-N1)-methyltransferase TrmD [Spirochaetota bacterium]
MIFKILTLFPEFFKSPLSSGLMGRAAEKGLMKFDIRDIRSYTEDRHNRCDDYPYGGGSGMVLMPDPLFRAIEDAKNDDTRILLTAASGRLLTQEIAGGLAAEKELCIICGHYEGVDQRVIDRYVDLEVSIGDYVLSGGEYAALVIIDAVARLIPGFMSNSESLVEESFEKSLLEYPHYTRPPVIDDMAVPGVLMGGNHGEISEWRMKKSIEITKRVRPDLYKRYIKSKILGE